MNCGLPGRVRLDGMNKIDNASGIAVGIDSKRVPEAPIHRVGFGDPTPRGRINWWQVRRPATTLNAYKMSSSPACPNGLAR
jgi:hypothetical protein